MLVLGMIFPRLEASSEETTAEGLDGYLIVIELKVDWLECVLVPDLKACPHLLVANSPHDSCELFETVSALCIKVTENLDFVEGPLLLV